MDFGFNMGETRSIRNEFINCTISPDFIIVYNYDVQHKRANSAVLTVSASITSESLD